VYSVLCVVGARLFLREAKHGPGAPIEPGGPAGGEGVRPDLVMAY